MKKIYYNKLVRDRIPEKIEKSGGDYKIRKMGVREYGKELLKKAEEEASGLFNAKGKQGIANEIGDVLDVIDEIKRHFKIKDSEIKKSRKKEMKIKGGFRKKLFLIWSSDTGYKTNEKRYKARSKK